MGFHNIIPYYTEDQIPKLNWNRTLIIISADTIKEYNEIYNKMIKAIILKEHNKIILLYNP